MAKLIKSNGEESEVFPKDGKSFKLEEMQELVREGEEKTVEFVYLPDGNLMMVNENGKLIGLPENEKATAIFRKQFPIEDYPINNDGLIVGNAVIMTAVESGEEDEDDECKTCGGTGEVSTMERVYPGEPHMADVGTGPCPDCQGDED